MVLSAKKYFPTAKIYYVPVKAKEDFIKNVVLKFKKKKKKD